MDAQGIMTAEAVGRVLVAMETPRGRLPGTAMALLEEHARTQGRAERIGSQFGKKVSGGDSLHYFEAVSGEVGMPTVSRWTVDIRHADGTRKSLVSPEGEKYATLGLLVARVTEYFESRKAAEVSR